MHEPSGVSLRINAERILLVAWLRAILLQLAHPLIAAGVSEHSTFRGSAWASGVRLHQTIGAMLAISFGTAGERQAAIDAIAAIHRRVRGTLRSGCGPFAAGTPYTAEDPALLLWVHVTLVESILLAYEQLVAPLTAAQRDRYCAESADVAVALGAHADAVPRSWDALRAGVARGVASGQIAVGDQARALAASVVKLPILPLLAAGQLPAEVRLQYNFDWSEARERRFQRLIALLRAGRRIVPKRVAWWKMARSRNC